MNVKAPYLTMDEANTEAEANEEVNRIMESVIDVTVNGGTQKIAKKLLLPLEQQ